MMDKEKFTRVVLWEPLLPACECIPKDNGALREGAVIPQDDRGNEQEEAMSELREVLLNAVAEIPHAERFHTEVVNKILALSEMKELREKAEKWDRINESTGGELQNLFTWIRSLESNLSTIMQDLVVEESRLKREWGGIESIGEPEYVTDTRPATAGEVREVIVWIFSDLDVGNKILADNKGWYFLLKSGGRLRLEK